MKYIEVHMPKSDYEMLWASMDTSSWYVFGVYDKEVTEQIKALFKQIQILKSNETYKKIPKKSQEGSSPV